MDAAAVVYACKIYTYLSKGLDYFMFRLSTPRREMSKSYLKMDTGKGLVWPIEETVKRYICYLRRGPTIRALGGHASQLPLPNPRL